MLTCPWACQEFGAFVAWGKPATTRSGHTISAQKGILSLSKKPFCASSGKLKRPSAPKYKCAQDFLDLDNCDLLCYNASVTIVVNKSA